MLKQRIIKIMGVVSLICMSHLAWSGCSILTSAEQPAPPMTDAMGQLLLSHSVCPTNVYMFRRLLQDSGLKLATTMVANRGYHNPVLGSFSVFEMVTGTVTSTKIGIEAGDFFFGHFTTIDDNNELALDQTPAINSLMIEAFAWDQAKGVYNFYELRGNGHEGQWYYRGDSVDILLDNENLHRQSDPKNPQFGNRLRCSACHQGGGPIMKELNTPHNDWWQENRKLLLGNHLPNKALSEIMNTLVSPDRLQLNVILGIKKLEGDERYQAVKRSHTWAEQLRPLFCPMEINLQSDLAANDEQQSSIAIPAAFFIDTRLLPAQHAKSITISRRHYEDVLQEAASNFPETTQSDADHAWLTPVKATSDQHAVDTLIQRGLLDKRFVYAVLAVDMTNPVISSARCSLLRLLPEHYGKDWQAVFIKRLANASQPAAKELWRNLTDPRRTEAYYQHQAIRYLASCQQKAENAIQVRALFGLLTQRRLEIATSEISANPRGRILEPGFRIIFPETNLSPVSGKLSLNASCDVMVNN